MVYFEGGKYSYNLILYLNNISIFVLNGFACYAAQQSTSKRWSGDPSLMQNRIDETVMICRFLAKDDPNTFNPISRERFAEILTDLPGKKGGDLQGLTVEHLRHLQLDTQDIIRDIINDIMKGILMSYSDTLINTRIATMIYKGKRKNRQKVGSYRRVSIGSIFQKVIDQQMIKHMGAIMRKAQSKRQFGFTEKLAINQCVLLRELAIQQSEEFKEPLMILAADVSQAFSSTEKTNQLFELLRSGESTKYFDYSDATYRNSTVYMKGGKEISVMIVENIGAPQGGKKSAPDFKGYNQPLIRVIDNSGIGYSLMIHKVEEGEEISAENIKKETFGIILVADDSLAMCSTEAELKALITAYETYADDYFLDFAFSKVILNVWGDKKLLKKLTSEKKITIKGHQPIYAEESVHLGTIVCADHRKTNLANIRNRIRATNGKLYHLLGTVIAADKALNQEVQREAYLTYLRSSLKSTLECFPFKDSEMKLLLDYEKKMLRRIFKHHSRSKTNPLYLLMGIVPIDAVIHMDMFSLFHNIWATKDETETADVCRAFMLKKMRIKTWPVFIRELAERYGIPDPLECLNHPAPSKEVWSSFVKKRIFHYHEMALKSKVNSYASTPFLNVNGLSLRNRPSKILQSAVTPYETQSLNVTIKHLISEYPNANNLSKRGDSDKNCKLCRLRGKEIKDDSLHNLSGCEAIWEDDRVLRAWTDYVNRAAAVLRKDVYETWREFTSDKNLFVQMILDPLSDNLDDTHKLVFTDLKEIPVEDRDSHAEENKTKADLILKGQKFVKVCDETRANYFKKLFGYRHHPSSKKDDARKKQHHPGDSGLPEQAQGNSRLHPTTTSGQSNKCPGSQVGDSLKRCYDVIPGDVERASVLLGRPVRLEEALPNPDPDDITQLVAVFADHEALAVSGSLTVDEFEDLQTVWKYCSVEENKSANRWSGGLMIIADDPSTLSNISIVEGIFKKEEILEWKGDAGLFHGVHAGESLEEEIPATLVFLHSSQEFDLYHSSMSHAVKKIMLTSTDTDPSVMDLRRESPYPKAELMEMSFNTDNWFAGTGKMAENPLAWIERRSQLRAHLNENITHFDLASLLSMEESTMINWMDFMKETHQKKLMEDTMIYMLMMSSNMKWPTKRVASFQYLQGHHPSIRARTDAMKLAQEMRVFFPKEEMGRAKRGKRRGVHNDGKKQSSIKNFLPTPRELPVTLLYPEPEVDSDEDIFATSSDDSDMEVREEVRIGQYDGADDTSDVEEQIENIPVGDKEEGSRSTSTVPSGDLSSLCSCFDGSRAPSPDCPCGPGCRSMLRSPSNSVKNTSYCSTSAAEQVERHLWISYGRVLNDQGQAIIPPSETAEEIPWPTLDGEGSIPIPEGYSDKIWDRMMYVENEIRLQCPEGDDAGEKITKYWEDRLANTISLTNSSRSAASVHDTEGGIGSGDEIIMSPGSVFEEEEIQSTSTPNLESSTMKESEALFFSEEKISADSLRTKLARAVAINKEKQKRGGANKKKTKSKKRKETPVQHTLPVSKLRSDCSYSGHVLTEHPSGETEATIVPILHPKPKEVRLFNVRSRAVSAPSKVDLAKSTAEVFEEAPKEILNRSRTRKKITFGASAPAAPPSTPSKIFTPKKRSPKVRALSGEDLRHKLSPGRYEERIITPKKSPGVINVSSSSGESSSSRKNTNKKKIRFSLTQKVDEKPAAGEPVTETFIVDLAEVRQTNAVLVAELDLMVLFGRGEACHYTDDPDLGDDERKERAANLEEINILCRKANRVKSNINSAARELANVVLDGQGNIGLNNKAVDKKISKKLQMVQANMWKLTAKQRIMAAAKYYIDAIVEVSEVAKHDKIDERVQKLKKSLSEQEEDMYIIAYILRFSTSMPRVPEFWENRFETLKEGRVRALTSDPPVSGAEPVNLELISYNAGSRAAVMTNSKDEDECDLSRDDFYTEHRVREECLARYISTSLQLFIYYVFYVAAPLLLLPAQFSSIIPSLISSSF